MTLQLTIECGGNGRSEYNPPASGNQWTVGAVGSPRWTGVRLKDVLEACGIKDDAVYVGYIGADKHLTGDPNRQPISRGVPMRKALEAESLIAFEMNGEPLPWLNGHPVRLVTAGWPASTSGKWLKKILIRNKVHDGAKMTGQSYRVPKVPVAPGTKVPNEDMMIIESMPVKSIVTFPKSGVTHKLGEKLAVRGHAWAGDLEVAELHVSIDFGGDVAEGQAREAGQPPGLAALERRGGVPAGRLLRGLGPRRRQQRQEPADDHPGLEPEGLPQ